MPLPGLAEGSIIGNPVVLDGEIAVFVGDPSGAIGVLKPDGSGGWRSEQTTGLTRDTLSRIVSVGDGLVALGGGEMGPWRGPRPTASRGSPWPCPPRRPTAASMPPSTERRSSMDGHTWSARPAAWVVGPVAARWARCGAGRRSCSSPDLGSGSDGRRADQPAGQPAQAARQRLAEPVAQRGAGTCRFDDRPRGRPWKPGDRLAVGLEARPARLVDRMCRRARDPDAQRRGPAVPRQELVGDDPDDLGVGRRVLLGADPIVAILPAYLARCAAGMTSRVG